MLSICIPVYNCVIETLVDRLYQQKMKLDEQIEIILIDDCSNTDIQELNQKKSAEKALYIQLDENIGRARIRNLFLKYANQPYLVFLDCDVVISSDEFLSKYYEIAKEESYLLVSGGHFYSEFKPQKEFVLRWKFGQKRETPKADVRMINPYKSFKTSNFMVSQKLFEKLHFDEKIKGYGHEDTLFGIEAKANKVDILHIDNPVFIADLDTNETFIRKTESSIDNLLWLLVSNKNKEELFNYITLLKAYRALKKKHLLWVVRLFYKLFGKTTKSHLLSGKLSNLRIFDLYKLGYLIENVKK